MKLLYIAVVLVFIQQAAAQTIKILDVQSQQPLDMVHIGAKGAKFSTSTNSNGLSDISALSSYDTLIIEIFGYETRYVSQQEITALENIVYLTSAVFNQDEFVISATRWRQSKKGYSTACYHDIEKRSALA